MGGTTVCHDCGDEYSRIRQHWAMSDCEEDPEKSSKVALECAECGGGFEVYRYRYESDRKRDNQKYCSPECKSLATREGAEVECHTCGELTYKSPANLRDNDRHFCNKTCESVWRSERLSGDKAPWSNGARLTRDTVDAVRNRLSDRSWEDIAEEVRAENDGCELCGVERSEIGYELDVHHIIPVAAGGTNGKWNLIPLCRSCHNLVEARTGEIVETAF